MADIQRRVDEKNGRNLVSRAFNAQSDKDAIVAWKEDLNRTLHVFNVRSLNSKRNSLIVSFQTELSIDTNATVTDSHLEATKIRREVTDMHKEVTNMRQAVLEIKEGVLNKRSLVCQTSSSPTNGFRPFLRLKRGLRQ